VSLRILGIRTRLNVQENIIKFIQYPLRKLPSVSGIGAIHIKSNNNIPISSLRLARIVEFRIAASHSSNRSLVEYDAYCNKFS
jgi:hypothetical protein